MLNNKTRQFFKIETMRKEFRTLLLFFLTVFTTTVLVNSCAKEYSCERCRELNKPPIANAGPDQVTALPIDSVSLDGTRSNDQDGTIVEWLWTKISGPSSATINNPSLSATVVKDLAAGLYQFELKVTDNGGSAAKDTVTITVDTIPGFNRPPVANAGPDQEIILPANATTLNGGGSKDPDNNITNYEWTKISGPVSFNILNATNAQPQITNLVEGTYLFELKVTDAGGLFSRDTMQVIVKAAGNIACNSNNRPMVNAHLIPFGTLSQARSGIAVASAGNKIVFAGGYSVPSSPGNSAIYHSTVDIYDIATQSWSVAALSVARSDIAAIAAGNKIFFAGGHSVTGSGNLNYYATIDIYDVVTNTWSVSYLSEPRSLIAAATVGDKVFFAGGSINGNINYYGQVGTPTSKVDIYNITTQSWSTAILSQPRNEIAAVTLHNKIYFAGGGAIDDVNLNVSNRIDIYDDVTGAWSRSTLQGYRTSMSSIAVGDKIYWAGGNVWPYFGVFTCAVEILDVVTNSNTISNLHYDNWWRFNGGQRAVLKENNIIFCIAPWNSDKFDIYNINTNQWFIGVLPSVCTDNSVIAVNNSVYIAGGRINGVLSNRVWKLEF